jgi:aminoglycoside 6'-N-acetyltransferase I
MKPDPQKGLMKVRRSRKTEFPTVFRMARKLWPDVKRSDLDKPKFTYYIAEENDRPVGFIMLAKRRDYVEGTTTTPVGYVEGIFVEKQFRRKKIGKKLIDAAVSWCLKKGYQELGSDVKFSNKVSQKFHSKAGFTRSERLVHYVKKISA